jgi:hypothetical protein
MKKSNENELPGFTAEMSLYETAISYRTMVSRAGTRIITAVQPALMIGGGPLGAKCTSTDGGSTCSCPKGICKAGKDYCECSSTAFTLNGFMV